MLNTDLKEIRKKAMQTTTWGIVVQAEGTARVRTKGQAWYVSGAPRRPKWLKQIQ